MDTRAFTAGVVPGGLTSETDIKILLCYLAASLSEPISHALFLNALTKEGLANYFECADALNDLLAAGNLRLSEDNRYEITETGRNISENLSLRLPLTVRERALRLAEECVTLQKNRQQHLSDIRETENGFMVRCYINEGDSEVFAVELYAPSKRHAQNIQQNFVKKGELIVRTVLEQLAAEPEE